MQCSNYPKVNPYILKASDVSLTLAKMNAERIRRTRYANWVCTGKTRLGPSDNNLLLIIRVDTAHCHDASSIRRASTSSRCEQVVTNYPWFRWASTNQQTVEWASAKWIWRNWIGKVGQFGDRRPALTKSKKENGGCLRLHPVLMCHWSTLVLESLEQRIQSTLRCRYSVDDARSRVVEQR